MGVKTYFHARYHRLARRPGEECAPVAVGNSILTIAWYLLSDHDARFTDGCAFDGLPGRLRVRDDGRRGLGQV